MGQVDCRGAVTQKLVPRSGGHGFVGRPLAMLLSLPENERTTMKKSGLISRGSRPSHPLRQMTRHLMPFRRRAQQRFPRPANLHHERAARVKAAARREIEYARNIARK